MFPDAPQPFLDLSTGINPFAYPLPPLPVELFERLPDSDALARLTAAAARYYGAPSPAHVTAAPGTQSLLPLVARLRRPGRAVILAPTYAEHARVLVEAGHAVEETSDADRLGAGDIAVVVNPNNPDGRLLPSTQLETLRGALAARGGLLVVDEAFMDVAAPGVSLAPRVEAPSVVVLRSFGKFFGLAGLRLGFALADPATAAALSAMLGPWAVSGPALQIGGTALDDDAWAAMMRTRLADSAAHLDAILQRAGCRVVGGTALFRLAECADASAVRDHLGWRGIIVRSFAAQPSWLRFGLPGGDADWVRLEAALDDMGAA